MSFLFEWAFIKEAVWTFSVALTAISVVFGIRVYYLNYKNNIHTRIEAHIKEWYSERMRKALAEACIFYFEGRTDLGEALAVVNFFQDLGHKCKKRVLPYALVRDEFEYSARRIHCMLKPGIEQFRKDTDDKEFFEDFDQMVKRFNRRPGLKPLSDDDILKFAVGQVASLRAFLSSGELLEARVNHLAKLVGKHGGGQMNKTAVSTRENVRPSSVWTVRSLLLPAIALLFVRRKRSQL